MAKLAYIRFFPGDWLRDAVSGCSLAAQGLWLRMMMIAHDSDQYGYLSQHGTPIRSEHIAQRCGTPLDQYLTLLEELDRHGIPSRTDEGIIYSRRMVRDWKKMRKSMLDGKKGGNPALKGGVNPPDIPVLMLKNDVEDLPGKSAEKGARRVEFFELIPEQMRVPKFLDAWRDWLLDRKKRRKPYTEIAARRALPKLADEGVDAAVQRIDRSITNGWQGLFFQNETPARGTLPARKSKHEEYLAGIERACDEAEAEEAAAGGKR